MTADRQITGRRGERLAAEWLQARGYEIVARNWRSGRSGEIDLVARQGPRLVIVEVRTRRGQHYGSAEESVTPAKQARLAALTEAYCAEIGWQGPVCIDVVAITLGPTDAPLEIRHIEDAVAGGR